MQNYMHLIKQKHMKKDISDNGKSETKLQVNEGGYLKRVLSCRRH